jgi:hypothetical protein
MGIGANACPYGAETLTELQAVASDGKRLHDYLVRSSMIEGLRRAAAMP